MIMMWDKSQMIQIFLWFAPVDGVLMRSWLVRRSYCLKERQDATGWEIMTTSQESIQLFDEVCGLLTVNSLWRTLEGPCILPDTQIVCLKR